MAEFSGASSQRDPIPWSGTRNEDVVPTLRDLSLLPVPNWYLLGLQLGVSADKLDMIESNYTRNNDLCKVKMFGAWLRMDTSATYRKLVRALVTLGNRNIAKEMCTKRGIPLTVLDGSDLVATVETLPPQPTLPQDLPKCVTRYTREGSQKLEPCSSTQRVGSQPSSFTLRKRPQPQTARSQKPGTSSSTQSTGSQKPGPSSSTQSAGSQKPGPSSSTQRARSQKPGPSSSTQRARSQKPGPSSSTQSAGSQKPGPTSLSHLAELASAAAPETTKQTPFRKTKYSCASTEGSSVNPVPISSTRTQKPLVTGSPTSTSSAFPYLKVSELTPEEQERLRFRLWVESEDIADKFWYLYSRVYKSLCERNVPVDNLVTHLLLLRAFDPVYNSSQKPALQTFFQDLQSAESIEKVLYIISDYFSFFNYRVIEHIVDGLGTDQDRVELQNYKREFDEYSKRRIYECPPDYGSKSSVDHADLVFKVDSMYDDFTVEELSKFQHKLSRILGVSPQSVLRLCRVEEGCLQLIFQVPSFVQQEIFPLTSEQETALAAEGVIRLTCGDYKFAAKGDENGAQPKDIGMVVSAGALQTTKQSSFSEQDTSKSSENVVTSEDASVSPGPSSTTQSEKTQNPFKTGCLITTSITSSFPYLKVSGLTPEQQEGLRIRLCGESKDIVRKFGNLHSRVYESLCEQNVPVDRLVAHLLSLSGFDPVYKDSQKPVLQSFNKELRSAGSIKVVLFIIRDYISFFNYRVIERIVEGLGTDQDKVELQNYEREFDEYSKRRVFERPPEYGSKSDSDRVDSIFVLDSVYERFTVKELKMFQYRLSKILNISPQSVVRFCGVGEVPFQLNLQRDEDGSEPDKTPTMVSARALQTTKQSSFSEQDISKSSENVFTSEDVSVSPGPSSTTQNEETQNPLKTDSLTTTPSTSSFPYLKVSGLTQEQQEGLRIRLCVEAEDMMHKFWHLHSRVYKSLCERNVPVDRLVAHLLSLHAFDPVYKDSQKPALQTFLKDLQNGGNIEEVLFIIRDCISFFNYHVIEHIVDGLGTDQDRVELQNYEREFDEYSKRRVYECPPVYGAKSDAEHIDLVVKVDFVYEKFTVEELRKFQYRLSTILHVSSQSVLRLCRVEEGCLQLIFQVPSFVQQELFLLSSEQERALAAEGVIRLTCGDYQFTAKGDENRAEPKHIATMFSARALQTTKQSSFSEQDTSKSSENVVTSEDVSVSPGPSSTTQNEEIQNPLKTDSLTTTPSTSSFPYLKVSGLTQEQQEGLRIRLCVESEDIVHKFWHLHSRVYESLRERNVPVGRLVTHLFSLRAFDPVYKGSQKPALQSFIKELQSAGSIEDVLFIIRDRFSFFNYHVIEHIVDGLGTDQDRVELQNYKREFDQYSKHRVSECPPVYGPKSDADHCDLVVKVDSVFEKFTVEELRKFQYRLSRILGVSPQSVLRLCQVEEGCVQLIFQVPLFVQQEIFPLSNEQESTLAAEGVIKLTCGDYQFGGKGDEPEDAASTSSRREEIRSPGHSTKSEGSLETGSPPTTYTISSFPYLKISELIPEQQEELSIRLCVESEDIVHKFWRLHSRVYKSLCERNVPVDKLVTHLLCLGTFDPVYKSSQKPALQTFFKDLQSAESIEKVLFIISDYFSFFNYHVIEHIVDGLGTDQDRVELQNYEREFDEYSKCRVYECPQVYGPKSNADRGDLVVKVDSVFENFTVEELRKFQYRLSRTFCVPPQSVLRLCQVREGCLQPIFQVPLFVQEESALPTEGVIRLTCGDHQFASKGDEDGSEPEDTESVPELRVPVFQAALTVHDIDADSAIGMCSSIITDDRSSCRFSNDEEVDPLSKEIDELDEENTLQLSSGHQLTESTPELHRAAMRGDLKTMRLLVDKDHQNPLQKNKYGDTAIHVAAQGGSLDVLKYFIDDRNCNPACLGQYGRTPLHDASDCAHLDVVKYLVTEQQVEPLCQDEGGWTPLHISCVKGGLDIVKFLTEEIEKYKPMKDLMPSLTTKKKNTPLHFAALNGHLDIVRFFITDCKCNPNIPGRAGRHPLHSAAERGHLHIMKYLIDEQQCDPSCLKTDNGTPLHSAAVKGHLDIVKYLTSEKHCNPTSRNSYGTTPIHWAAQNGNLEILQFLITDLKCNPNIPGECGRTPLHVATEQGHLHIMKYLIDEQACDPSCLDSNNQTSLHHAASNGHLDIAKFLTLEKHCNPNQRDIQKNTPLHTAAIHGHLQVVQFFVEDLKCPPNTRGQVNATPRQMAKTKGHRNVALYLQKFQHSTN